MRTSPIVLIVDDLEVNRVTIKLSLKDENYHFFEASNGKEAIKKAKMIKPDIILMDAIMPIMDGFEATKKIRQIESIWRVPILMITSLVEKKDKLKALEAGVNDFISKPFDKLELKARCRSYANFSSLNKKYILATKHNVTNLPNKTALFKNIVNRIENKKLFLLKIDNFEIIENFYGSEITEKLELEFSKQLPEFFKIFQKYSLYHVQSGEFAILLRITQELSKKNIESFCEKITKQIKSKKIIVDEYSFDISITIVYIETKLNLYEDAKAILNYALSCKREFLLADGVLRSLKLSFKKNLNMITTVKNAIDEDKILPFFQPIYDNKMKVIPKYEALVRLIDQQGNLISPDFFLKAAKQGKFYPQIIKIVVNKVFDIIASTGVEVSVNLSSSDIEDRDISSFLLEKIRKNPTIASNLIIEILEDKNAQNHKKVKVFIKKIKQFGVKIAIDDFGSGFSNFMRVLEFEPDFIKIDGSLVKDIAICQNSKNTVETIKIFADKIGAKTIAEYVENEYIFNIVNELGIDYSQGHFIGKAMPDNKAVFSKSIPIV